MKRTLPLIIGSIIGFGLMLDNFFKVPILNSAAVTVRSWLALIALFSLMVGALNLILVHVPRVTHKRNNWIQSAVLLTFLSITVLVGLALGTSHTIYTTLYKGVLTSGSTAVNALLAFFIASAAVRVFRARSLESSLLLLTAIILMLSNVSIGSAISSKIPLIGKWINDVPNATAQRGLIVTSSLAVITINLRNILGMSTQWLGGKE